MFEKQSEADSKKDDVRARKSENLLIRNEKLLEIAYWLKKKRSEKVNLTWNYDTYECTTLADEFIHGLMVG